MSLSMSLSFFSLNNLKIHLLSPFTSSDHFPLPHLSTLKLNLKTHSVMNSSSFINVHMRTNKFIRRASSQTSAKFSPPNLSIWTRLVLLGSILLTVPFYKRILKVGDRMEKTAETTVEIVERVTEETKKVASDIAGALPEGNLKQEVLEVEKFAEEVEKDAKNVEVFLHKVDKIKEEVEELMEPLIEKEQREKEKQDIMDEITSEN